MKILVTGSNGFIGKLLSNALKRQGHEVFGFDRSGGQDILNVNKVKQAVKGMDAVYHLAASLREDDKLLNKINFFGTKNVLEACAKAQVGHFIFLSTVGVMGEIKKIANEQTPLNPQTPYEKSKARAEELVLTYQEVLPVTVVRSAIVLGPNKEWEKIVKMIKKGIPLIGNGKNLWQMIYIKDLLSALVVLLNKEEAIGETFIVAEERPKTLLEIVKIVRKEIGVKKSLVKIPVFLGVLFGYALLLYSKILNKHSLLTPAYIARLLRLRHYSIEKIKKTGWKPQYSTEQAIKETVKEFGKN